MELKCFFIAAILFFMFILTLEKIFKAGKEYGENKVILKDVERLMKRCGYDRYDYKPEDIERVVIVLKSGCTIVTKTSEEMENQTLPKGMK